MSIHLTLRALLKFESSITNNQPDKLAHNHGRQPLELRKIQTADNTTRPKRNFSKLIWLMKDLGSLGKADDEEDPQKVIVSSAVTGQKRISVSSTADVLSEGGQQKTKRMPSTGDTVSSAAASKSSPLIHHQSRTLTTKALAIVML